MPLTETNPIAETFDVAPERFVEHLKHSAANFFPDLPTKALEVRVVKHSRRHQSQLLELQLNAGRQSRTVIYKIPFCLERVTAQYTQQSIRPRLYPEAEQTSNGLREYKALKSIEEHFRMRGESRFGVIRVLDLLRNPFVVVMEKSPLPDLKTMLKASSRFHSLIHTVHHRNVFEHAGAWLREFHSLPPLQHTETRHQSRGEFVSALSRFTGALAQDRWLRTYALKLERDLTKLAENRLPQNIPRAVIHGDFAPRNILVSDTGSITVFDTQRRWLAPAMEDLAYFLNSLKAAGPQARTQGLVFSRKQLAAWEAEFLRGYYSTEEAPVAMLRLYECLLLLEWWVATRDRLGGGNMRQRMSVTLTQRFLKNHLSQLMTDVRRAS